MKHLLSTLLVLVVMLAAPSQCMAETVQITTVTIASGAALSDVIDLSDRTLVGIQMPTAWTAADLAFRAATSSAGTPVPLFRGSDTARYQIKAAASRHFVLSPLDFAGARWIQLESVDTGGNAVNQGADRTITLLYRKVQ